VVAVGVLCPLVAYGDPMPACDRYSATPNGALVDLLADPMPTFETGQALPSYGAFVVKLKSSKKVIYPYKSPNDHDAGLGAVLAIEYVPAGTVRISLSAPAQLDAIQDNQLLPQKTRQLTGDCPGIAHTVDVQSVGGPFILQISGGEVELLKMLVTPLPAKGSGTTGGIREVSAAEASHKQEPAGQAA